MIESRDWQIPNFNIFEFKPKKTRYCICIPVINEGKKFKKQLVEMKEISGLADVIIADLGSTDGSTDTNFLKLNNVRTLLVKTDLGKLSAQLRMGYYYGLNQGYKGIITIDGNGKDGIEAIPRFIKELDEGFDYIQGSRFIKGGCAIRTPIIRYLAIRLIHAPLISLTAHHWLTDTTNGFRAYSRKYLLDPRVQPFRSIFGNYELLAYLSARASQIGFRVKEIPVERKYPKGKIPTKISSLAANWDIFITALKGLVDKFNPD